MFVEAFVGAFGLLLDWQVWLFVIFGAFFGVVIGALPGIGTTLGYALLIPVTLALPPVVAVSMLLSVAVGGQFGNSLPAILLGVPGGPSAMMTVLDGHALYKKGRGDLALGASYLAALVGQAISVPLFVLLVIPLAGLAYVFQAPELFAMFTLGMVAIVSLVSENVIKGLLSVAFGMALALVGLDPLTSTDRFTFGIRELRPGLDEAALVVGLLAVGELFRQARQRFQWREIAESATKARVRMPSLKEMGGRDIAPALLGGTLIGTLEGAIPGGGATTASLVAYQQAKLWSKHPEEFGKGSLTGIIANESAQNASNSGELIPTLALGIPASGSMLVLLAALTVQGFVPGPFLITRNPELLYAAIAGLLGGTIILAIVGMRLAGWMLIAARIDRSAVIIASLALVVVGVWALNGSVVDVVVVVAAGIVGYVMYTHGYNPAAAALAVVLGRGFEESLRHGLALSDDSFITMATRPVTAALLIASVVLLIIGFWKEHRFRARMKLLADPPGGIPSESAAVSRQDEP